MIGELQLPSSHSHHFVMHFRTELKLIFSDFRLTVIALKCLEKRRLEITIAPSTFLPPRHVFQKVRDLPQLKYLSIIFVLLYESKFFKINNSFIHVGFWLLLSTDLECKGNWRGKRETGKPPAKERKRPELESKEEGISEDSERRRGRRRPLVPLLRE